MPSPALTPVPDGGSPAANPSEPFLPRGTYAAAASTKPRIGPRLNPVQLIHRPPTYVDNIPGVLLTAIEEEQLCKQRENTLS